MQRIETNAHIAIGAQGEGPETRVAGATHQHIVAGSAFQIIVSNAPYDGVVAFVPVELVVARSQEHGFGIGYLGGRVSLYRAAPKDHSRKFIARAIDARVAVCQYPGGSSHANSLALSPNRVVKR